MPRPSARRIFPRFRLGLRSGLWLGGLAAPIPTVAQDKPPPIFGPKSLTKVVCDAAGYNCDVRDERFLVEVAGTVVFAMLSLLGVVFTALLVYGGYRWMLARGDEAKITEAKGIIRHAIIGLAITLAAYSIWVTVSSFL